MYRFLAVALVQPLLPFGSQPTQHGHSETSVGGGGGGVALNELPVKELDRLFLLLMTHEIIYVAN